MESVRIAFEYRFTVIGYGVLIHIVTFKSRDESFVHAAFRNALHRRKIFVPAVKVPHYGNFFRMRRPYSEINSFFAVFHAGVTS